LNFLKSTIQIIPHWYDSFSRKRFNMTFFSLLSVIIVFLFFFPHLHLQSYIRLVSWLNRCSSVAAPIHFHSGAISDVPYTVFKRRYHATVFTVHRKLYLWRCPPLGLQHFLLSL